MAKAPGAKDGKEKGGKAQGGKTRDGRLREGLRLQRAGKAVEAAKIYSEIVQKDPQAADAWHLLGTLELQKHSNDSAAVLIGRALSINPHNAIYHHNMAYIHGAKGALAEAATAYRKAIELDPNYAEAFFNLSGSVKFAPDDPAIAPLESLMAKPDLKTSDHCFLQFAAGKVYDDLGEHDRAFEHYREGNAAKSVKANPSYGHDYLMRIRAVCDAALFAARAGTGVASEQPVFVIGMPRSGTSLAEQILASHSQVHGAGELPDIDSISRELRKHCEGNPPYPEVLATVEPRVLTGLADAYIRRIGALAPEAKRIVDKAPLNFRHLGMIALMFPKARVVHCRRSALDTCLSCFFQNFAQGQDYSFDLEDLGRFYCDYQALMTHWRAVLPLEIYDLDYETLVSDPEPETRRLLTFCGLDWEPGCAAAHRTQRSVRTASRWQVRQPIYNSSVARWRRYERHLGPLIAALGPHADT